VCLAALGERALEDEAVWYHEGDERAANHAIMKRKMRERGKPLTHVELAVPQVGSLVELLRLKVLSERHHLKVRHVILELARVDADVAQQFYIASKLVGELGLHNAFLSPIVEEGGGWKERNLEAVGEVIKANGVIGAVDKLLALELTVPVLPEEGHAVVVAEQTSPLLVLWSQAVSGRQHNAETKAQPPKRVDVGVCIPT